MLPLRRALPGICLTVCLVRLPAAAADPGAVPGEVLVRWRAGGAGKVAPGSLLAGRYGPVSVEPLFAPAPARLAAARKVGAAAGRRRGELELWSRLRLPPDADLAAATADLAARPEVAAAQPNYLRAFAYTPNDPLYPEQWNLARLDWGRARPADAATVVVGVVDSGVDLDHPDLRDSIWRNLPELAGVAGVDDDGNGYVDDAVGWDFADAPELPGTGDYRNRDADPSDESGHGTHVAGIIAAGVGNGVGVAGVAPRVRLMALRAGFNTAGGGYLADDDVAAAVVYGVENGAQILNLSFGDPNPAPVLREVLGYARAAGVVVVAAAGNTGAEGVLYPARFPEAVAVVATGPSDEPLSFSSWGWEVDVAAPGLAITSLALGGGYTESSGTSMAAAHVSGLAALILARQPSLSPLQVRGALVGSARDAGPEGWDPWTGHGVATVAEAREQPLAAMLTAPEPGEAVSRGDSVTVELAGPDGAPYALTWSPASPLAWRDLASGQVAPGAGPTTAVRVALPQTEGEIVLEARVGEGEAASRSFVTLWLSAAVPAVTGLSWARVLEGGAWAHLVEWQTDRDAGGLLHVTGSGADLTLPVPGGRRDHWQVLPPDLPPGQYAAVVDPAGTGQGQQTVQIQVGPRGLAPLPARRVGELPDGYLMPALSDFDGDGQPEVVAMDESGAGYGPTGFWQLDPAGQIRQVHQSSFTFIPWSWGDLDGDGRLDLMAVDAERVRLLEAPAPGQFPTVSAWEQRDVWGGEVADLDGDGHLEAHLRSSRSATVLVYENRGNDAFAEVAVMANPTAGDNDLGERFVVGDFDGDGAGELLGGDADGDLFLYESVGDDAYRWVWSGPGPGGDARLVGGGADLDGDGEMELVAGGYAADNFDLSHARWVVGVYGVSPRGQLALEWQVRVLGGRPSRNGIAVGDLDGDGRPEFIAALPPYLYVFRATGPDQYEPVWWSPAQSPRRPAVGDVDGDGRVDLIFGEDGELAVYAFPA
ncbi:MAG: S8 family serine peptidase, partial [Gemmatimonadota bacterium]